MLATSLVDQFNGHICVARMLIESEEDKVELCNDDGDELTLFETDSLSVCCCCC